MESKTKPIIKTGFCVAYDWQLLKNSLPRIYQDSDIICLAIDKNRYAWSGEQYQFDDAAFYAFVSEVDTEKKIIIYEDNFFDPKLDKRQNCNRHRTMLAERLGKGGWHIQIDSDEYFIDFKGFTKYLKKINGNPQPDQKALNVCCAFVPLFKKTEDGYLYVHFGDKIPELIPMATNKPDYQRARQNGHFNHIAPFYVIHETWARDDDELWFKINNWGHASEELGKQSHRNSYYQLWKVIDKNNFQYLRNFNATGPEAWPSLKHGVGKNIAEFIENLKLQKFPLSNFNLALRNNRNIARIKSIFNVASH